MRAVYVKIHHDHVFVVSVQLTSFSMVYQCYRTWGDMVNLTQNPQYNYTVMYYYLNYSSGLCRQRYIRFAQLQL